MDKGIRPFIYSADDADIDKCPHRVGSATVLPGDVVLAKKYGVIFIPAYLLKIW